MTPTYQLIHQWASKPFIWGERDCALLLADWYKHLYGQDPAAHLRGQYHDLLSCNRLTGWLRDPVKVIEDCLATVGGLPRTDAPVEGDVGIINCITSAGVTRVSGIRLPDCWAARTEDPSAPVVTVNDQLAAPLACWAMGYNAT